MSEIASLEPREARGITTAWWRSSRRPRRLVRLKNRTQIPRRPRAGVEALVDRSSRKLLVARISTVRDTKVARISRAHSKGRRDCGLLSTTTKH